MEEDCHSSHPRLGGARNSLTRSLHTHDTSSSKTSSHLHIIMEFHGSQDIRLRVDWSALWPKEPSSMSELEAVDIPLSQ